MSENWIIKVTEVEEERDKIRWKGDMQLEKVRWNTNREDKIRYNSPKENDILLITYGEN